MFDPAACLGTGHDIFVKSRPISCLADAEKMSATVDATFLPDSSHDQISTMPTILLEHTFGRAPHDDTVHSVQHAL